jgi:hypothetical protein
LLKVRVLPCISERAKIFIKNKLIKKNKLFKIK